MRLSRFNSPIQSALALCAIFCATLAVHGQAAQAAPALTPPLSRTQQLREDLEKLSTTGRIMHVVAHPDDEDGALITLQARGQGDDVLLMTLTRGEGGQNIEGAVFLDELGILRTLELLAADRIYGAQERFASVADFGFSKTASETYEKWGGRDTALADIVRVIREFKPDVLVTRFSGTPRDGHGNHQASGQLTMEAFRAAADPNRFPEQIREGLQPWQASKLYIDNVGDEATLVLDLSDTNPLLGGAPAVIAFEGLRHQASQGLGNYKFPTSRRIDKYKLQDTANGIHPPAHETGMLDGIDTVLAALATRLNTQPPASLHLQSRLLQISNEISAATSAESANGPAAAAPALAKALGDLQSLERDIAPTTLDPADRNWLLTELRTKDAQLTDALRLATGLELSATVARPAATDPFVAPGEQLAIHVKLRNTGRAAISIPADALHLSGPLDLTATEPLPPTLAAGHTADIVLRARVRTNAPATRPYFHRNDPVRDGVYQISDPAMRTLPLQDAAFHLDCAYILDGTRASVEQPVRQSAGFNNNPPRPLFVAPPVDVKLAPAVLLMRADANGTDLSVNITSYSPTPQQGTVALTLPAGWHAAPASIPLTLAQRGSAQSARFHITPPTGSRQLMGKVVARVTIAGQAFSDGFVLVQRPDLDAFPYYEPAAALASVVDTPLPDQHNIGYIPGAGDTEPDQLRALGFTVTTITPEQLATGNLSAFDTILVGIRAYDVRDDVRKNNDRLLAYASAGGTLVVQYNQDVATFNAGHFTPYPATLSRDRVSVEEAEVTILRPEDPVFHYPNHIGPADFANWVQERGLYFMSDWAPDYAALLSCHDPNEPARDGGLLRAKLGKGTYIYTGYAFFRQLPAGVPGAVRLFVNLLSAGHSQVEQPVISARK